MAECQLACSIFDELLYKTRKISTLEASRQNIAAETQKGWTNKLQSYIEETQSSGKCLQSYLEIYKFDFTCVVRTLHTVCEKIVLYLVYMLIKLMKLLIVF